jgi:methionyl-tRNA formyltransferase
MSERQEQIMLELLERMAQLQETAQAIKVELESLNRNIKESRKPIEISAMAAQVDQQVVDKIIQGFQSQSR